jgi:hypothetical protein
MRFCLPFIFLLPFYRNSHFINSSHFFVSPKMNSQLPRVFSWFSQGFPISNFCQRAFLPLDDFFSVAAGRGMDGFYNDKARLWNAGVKKGQKHWGFWVILRDFKGF